MRWLRHMCTINMMLSKSVGLTIRVHAVLWLPPGCIQPACRAAWAEHLTCHSSQTAWNPNKCINFSTAAPTMLLGWKGECVQEIQLFGSLKSTKPKVTEVSLKLTVFSSVLAPAPLSSPWDKWPSTPFCMVQTPSQVAMEPVSLPAWVMFLKNTWFYKAGGGIGNHRIQSSIYSTCSELWIIINWELFPGWEILAWGFRHLYFALPTMMRLAQNGKEPPEQNRSAPTY